MNEGGTVFMLLAGILALFMLVMIGIRGCVQTSTCETSCKDNGHEFSRIEVQKGCICGDEVTP